MVDIRSTTTKKLPISSNTILKIKEAILGKKYELSLVTIGKFKAKNLNKKYRKKDYTPNILSFPIDNQSGEIFINLDCLKSECKERNMTPKEYFGFLLIHGCLHLNKITHGSKMLKLEDKHFKFFKSQF